MLSLPQMITLASFLAMLGVSSCRSVPENRETTPLAAVSGTLTDDEAARIALVNNAAFRELMSDLGIAEAELIQAKEFPNPTMSVLFPLGPKQLEYVAKFPVETLWLRPQRAKAATSQAESVARGLQQHGSDLIRDVKSACADLRLAEKKVVIARENLMLVKEHSDIAARRKEAGDISELEASTTRTDVVAARIEQERAPREVALARETLRNLLGASNTPADFSLVGASSLPQIRKSDADLLTLALAARPDLRAAELAIEAEGRRLRMAQAEVFKLTAVFDSNGDGSNFEAGPGLEWTLPLFHQNQGASALADSKFEKACRHYLTVKAQIAMEVRHALTRFRHAESEWSSHRNELIPALRDTAAKTELAWEEGEVDYLHVLDSSRRLQAARLAEALAFAEAQKAAAELERAIGANSSILSGK